MGACKRCGLPLSGLVCGDCGQDLREPTEDDRGIHIGGPDPNPEENWTSEQWAEWAQGDEDERQMIERMRRGGDH